MSLVSYDVVPSVNHSTGSTVQSDFHDSSDSDIPLASFKSKLAQCSDSDTDNVPLIHNMKGKPRKTSKRIRKRRTVQVQIYHCDSSTSFSDSGRDPDYNPHHERSESDSREKTLLREPNPSPTTPLKYLQVSVDALRVTSGDYGVTADTVATPVCSLTESSQSGNTSIKQLQSPGGFPNADVSEEADQSLETQHLNGVLNTIVQTPEPPPVKRGRKRRRQDQNSKDSKRKRALNLGEEYVSRKGKVTPRKSMKGGCGTSCRMHCHNHVTRDRLSLFRVDWW